MQALGKRFELYKHRAIVLKNDKSYFKKYIFLYEFNIFSLFKNKKSV